MSQRRMITYAALATLIVLGVVLTMSTRARHEPPRKAQDRKAYSQNYETFKGEEVAAKQILFKLAHCPAEDSQSLVARLTKFSRDLTEDESIELSQVGKGCLFLARSSRLNVPQLLAPFKSPERVKHYLAQFDLQSTLAYAEPNYVIRVKTHPEDGPFIRHPAKKSRQLNPRCRNHSGGPPVPAQPNDDLFKSGLLWGLKNTRIQGMDIDAIDAWQRSTGLPSIVVGVIDTGIYYDHPDLRDNVWSAPEDFDITLGGETLHCPRGSHGYNARATSPAEACDPVDNDSHGTHVAGIIGAVGDNHDGVVGVNWHTKLMALKFMDQNGGLVSDAINAIEFAIQVKDRFNAGADLRVLNASWGYGGDGNLSDADSTALREEIERANQSNILFVASAGEHNGNDNDVSPHYPSGYFDLANLLSVTAIDRLGALAVIHGSLSNHGQHSVHLAAPGKGIYSTYPVSLGYSYYQKSGTSMAAPFVSGAAALILSVPACSGLNASDLKRVITEGATGTRSVSLTATGGRLNVFRSISLCSGP